MAIYIKNDAHPVLCETKYYFSDARKVKYAESCCTPNDNVKYVFIWFNSNEDKNLFMRDYLDKINPFMLWGIGKIEEGMIAFEVYEKFVDAAFLYINIFEDTK